MALMSCESFAVRAGRPCVATTGTTVKLPRSTAAHASRRELGLQLTSIGVGLLGFTSAAVAAQQDSNKQAADNSDSSSSSGTGFIAIAPINNAAKSYMDMRDDAMDFQCKGGMFDCDGDRREFAHKQYMDWLESGGVPKRLREGKPNGPRSY
eukprot:GHUV01003715.1.p1 GENE.GHUV01003715.1~~GHUV01003715.1.p1  ORF type:complete len:152 (+),score=48.72 GHUV01003715.1:129-584(+)